MIVVIQVIIIVIIVIVVIIVIIVNIITIVVILILNVARVVIVMTDNCSHKLSKPAMARAREAGVPLVCGNHRKSSMSPLLDRAGFPLITGAAKAAAQGPLDVTQLAICGLPESTVSDLPLLSPEESLPMPKTIAVPTGLANLTPADLAYYEKALPIVAENPWLTSAEIAPRLDVATTVLYTPLRYAREALGIKAGVGAGASRIVNRALYEHGCEVLGITPVAENVGPTRLPYTAKDRNGGDRGQPGRGVIPASTAAKVIAAITPPPPLPASLIPAPEAPPEAPAKPAESATTEALRLLLEAMRAEGVEHVAISADGSVALRRRIVVSENLAL
jgi:hypothetical protein